MEETTKNRLRERLIERIEGASVLKTILPLTLICGCALAVSANAARTESLSFKTQTIFEKRTEKADPEPSRSGTASKDTTGKTVSAPIVEQSQKKADPKPSKSELVSKDRTGKTVPEPIVELSPKKADPKPSNSGLVSKDRIGKTVSAPVVELSPKKADPKPSSSGLVSKDRTGKTVAAPIVEKSQKKADPKPSKSEFVSKDRTGKTVSAPIVEQSQKKAEPKPSRSEFVSKDRTGKSVSAPIVEQSQKKADPKPSKSEFEQSPKKADPKPSKSEFVFKDRTGKTVSAPIVDQYQKNRIVHPMAKIDPRLDPKLSRAATIADERARAHSKSRCWRYVKEALVASGAVSSYPKTSLAKEAGDELVRDYGFKKLPIHDPYSAPIGSVLVYFKGRNRPGHVEIRTKTGFVSDYRSKDACKSALVGIYAKK